MKTLWSMFQFYDIRIGPDQIRVRIYDSNPHVKDEQRKPAIVFMHGGGWSIGCIGEIYGFI